VCDCQLNRREVITLAALACGAALASSPVAADAAAVEVSPGLSVLPRDAWGSDLPPTGALAPEKPKFLLVHHTASTNSYRSARDVIRSTYAFQTSAAKGWPDVCYHFFIGRDGEVWEGRAGSIAGPVVADATGGNQGFAQLVCLLGDFTAQAPTAAALASLAKVLAWLSHRYSIDIGDSATASFVSRGSQRWAPGATVTTPTIAAHRDMSFTACPGDALMSQFDEVRSSARAERAALGAGLRPAVRLGIVPDAP
jgi:N-acetylmuramoyl-L-alanine amidase